MHIVNMPEPGIPDGDDSFCYREPEAGTVHVGGSYGYFSVSKATGEIVAVVYFDPPGTPPRDVTGRATGYRDIARFDPLSFDGADSYDIVDVAFFTDQGERVAA